MALAAERISRMRQIIVLGGDHGRNVMRDSVHRVLQLAQSDASVYEILQREVQSATIRPMPELDVPPLFIDLARDIYGSCNPWYQQAIIFAFMVFDPDVFGQWMMHGESPAVRDHWMAVAKESTTNLILGVHMDGSIFRKDDSIALRKTGTWAIYLQSHFATL